VSTEMTDARALAAMLRDREARRVLVLIEADDALRIASELERLADLEAAMGNLCSRQPTCGGAI
jgi:hypothetical protein